MKEIDLVFGRVYEEKVLYNCISIDFEIEPRVYNFDDFSRFIIQSGGFFIKIYYSDMPYGVAAEEVVKVLKLFERLKIEKGSDFLDYTFIPREKVVLDFTKCSDSFDAYVEMRNKMEWEAWYGFSLDALWDILTGLPYRGDDFEILRLEQYKAVRYGREYCFTEEIDKICEIFLKAEKEHRQIKVSIRYVD